MVLKSTLLSGFETDELDSHANSGIAGAHQGAGRDSFFSHPQLGVQTSPDGKGRKSLDVTTGTADIGSGHADRHWSPAVVQSNQKVNFVALPSSSAGRGGGCSRLGLGEQSDPGRLRSAQKLHTHLNLLHRPGVRCPHYPASGFLIASLYSDGVADFEVMLDFAEQGATGADIVSASWLGKGTTICTHAPYTHREVDWDTLFRPG